MADPVMRELWEIKDALAEECGHDLERLWEKLAALQASLPEKLLERPAESRRARRRRGQPGDAAAAGRANP